MKLYIKNDMNEWVDLTSFIHTPSNVIDTIDGSYIKSNITLRIPGTFKGIDPSVPIEPKKEFKVLFSDTEIELVNAYYFYSKDQSSVVKRNEIKDELGNILVPMLWEHKLNGEERLSHLEGNFTPNYTVTQPKTKFFDRYRKSLSTKFILDQTFRQDGNSKTLIKGTKLELNSMNNDNVISMDYESGKHYVELKEIDEVGYDLSFNMFFRKTAAGRFKPLIGREQKIRPYIPHPDRPPLNKDIKEASQFDLEFTIKYLDANNNVISSTIVLETINYIGGLIPTTKPLINIPTILGFSEVSGNFKKTINIPKNTNAKKVLVELLPIQAYEENHMIETFSGEVDFTYNGINYTGKSVVTNIQEIEFYALSGTFATEQEEVEITLLEFLNKAIFDYNLNSRVKLTLDSRLEAKLTEPIKESEWVDYNFKELLERLFKYIGLRPYLTKDNVITYREEKEVPYFIDLDKVGKELEQIGDYHYDKVISKSKNLVSETDTITEVLAISSTDTEFSQVTDDNIGFILSNDIYYVKRAVLHAPNFAVVVGDYNVKTNIEKDYYWDITKRLFEEDIYNSFPDVRYDFRKTSILENKTFRKTDTSYSKSNTISYKSGTNMISNLGHLAPEVPTFSFLGTLLANPQYLTAQYSLIELLIVLAYESIDDLPEMPDFNVKVNLKDMFDYTLEVEYVPIFKDLTTKQVSNMSKRRGLNFERKFNINDRTVSLSESNEVLRKEMESKGNVKVQHNETLKSIEDSLSVNSIITNGLKITTKEITYHKNAIQVSYEMQENFILQNEDIRLPVSFDRYSVPYEYVNREVMLENYLVFNTEKNYRYIVDNKGSNIELLRQTIFSDNNSIKGAIYGLATLNVNNDYELKTLLRFGALKDSFSLILTGRYLDNYSAGVQRYAGKGNLVYSQPFRYTSGSGKLDKIDSLKIGYNIGYNGEHYVKESGGDYNFLHFPEGKDVDPFEKTLVETDVILYNKDAREGISYVHTSYLISENDKIKFYSFNNISGIGALDKNIEFIDDLDIRDVAYVDFGNDFTYITLNEIAHNIAEVEVKLNSKTESDFPNGILFYNQTENIFSLVGLMKNVIWTSNDTFVFYISSTSYGTNRSMIDTNYWLIDVGFETNYVGEVLNGTFFETNIDTTVNLDLAETLFGEATINYTTNYVGEVLNGEYYTNVIDTTVNLDLANVLFTDVVVSFNTSYSGDVLGTQTFNKTLTPSVYYSATVPSLTWKYLTQTSSDICMSVVYNPIGESCSVENQTMVVRGMDIGYGSGCHVLICKKEKEK